MKVSYAPLMIVCLLALPMTRPGAAEVDDLVATLQSSASAPEKWAACQRLRSVGTAACVPAVAGLLTDARLSQAARHVLEALPYPQAGTALQEALPGTSGLLKAGIITSLGWRGDASAIPPLVPLLSDRDTAIAAAAADALGRIGTQPAAIALAAAREGAPAEVQPALLEGLLRCAERFLSQGQSAAASSIYRDLTASQLPAPARAAAWRGLVLSSREGRAEMVLKALTGADPLLHAAALKLIRESPDPQVLRTCATQWSSLPVHAQMAVLDAHLEAGANALPLARTAAHSPDAALRAAAWQALGRLQDAASVPALAQAAARGESGEREAARDSLERLRGPGAREALLSALNAAPAAEKAELLRALGERGDRAAVSVLLQNAASEAQPVRLAALHALRRLAPAEAITPLLEIAARSTSDEQRDPVIQALYAVCEAAPDKEQTARSVVRSLEKFSPAERRQVLPLLAELATPEALAAAQSASVHSDLELAKEAVRVLSNWPNAGPAPQLLGLARTSTAPTLQTLALRAAIQVAGQEPDPEKRLSLFEQAMAAARNPEEKKQALGQIAQVPTPAALALARRSISSPDVAGEARLAALSVAEKLAPSNPRLADEVAAQILEAEPDGELARRAWALRLKPSSGASFIRDWMLCGPFRQPGLVGATAVFNVPFGPEKPGQAVEWKAAPPGDQVNLAALFPGQENCAAYVRTRLIAQEDRAAVLLIGSDDGVKAWLNGELVHSHNVDRGQVVDEDSALIQLRKGANDLVLKVTQGAGGWSACARVLGRDGQPIPNLLVERPLDAAPELRAPEP